jgi:hypothetical protein
MIASEVMPIMNRRKAHLSRSPLAPCSYRVDGPVAGLFFGGNYQINKIVLSVEGD